MPPIPGRLQARLRPSVISFSVILAHARIQCRCLCLCLSSFCHPRRLSPTFLIVIEDPVDRCQSTRRTRGSSVVLFAKTGRSKDPGSPIESGMTEGRKQRHPWRQIQGACRRGCAAVPNFLWGRGLFERSEFRSPNHSGRQRHPKGRAWAPMVLDPFAETKGSRRAGAKPRKHSLSPCGGETPQSSLHSVPDKPDDWNDHSCIGRATHRTQKKQREKC